VIDINDPLEFLGEDDECIKFTVAVGAVNGWAARAIAVDAGIEPGDPGNVWVGMHDERAFYHINGRTGALIQRVPPAGPFAGSPYGAAIDSLGRLWSVHGCCGAATLNAINTASMPAQVLDSVPIPAFTAGHGSYGIAVDTKDRVWIGAWPNGALKRYDPVTQEIVEVRLDALAGFGSGWGVRGVGIDTNSNVWAAIHTNSGSWAGTGRMARVDADTATATGFWQIPGEVPVGVGVDFDGNVWTVNQRTSNASRLHIDQTTKEPAPHPMTGNQIDTYPVGPEPYTYSDFTGLGLRIVTRASGEYSVPIQGCVDGAPAEWLSVNFDATTPPNTRVQIWVRSGNDLATLKTQPIYGPWEMSPADLQSPPGPVPDGRYLLLIIRLISEDRESTPIVHGYEVQWACPPPPVE
jgi:streptogramin lyase